MRQHAPARRPLQHRDSSPTINRRWGVSFQLAFTSAFKVEDLMQDSGQSPFAGVSIAIVNRINIKQKWLKMTKK